MGDITALPRQIGRKQESKGVTRLTKIGLRRLRGTPGRGFLSIPPGHARRRKQANGRQRARGGKGLKVLAKREFDTWPAVKRVPTGGTRATHQTFSDTP